MLSFFWIIMILHSFLHLLLTFTFSKHLNDLLLSKCLHVAWETKNVRRLIGLVWFLYLKFVGQLIFRFEPRNCDYFRLFALHQSLYQLFFFLFFFSFLLIGIIWCCGFSVSLWDEFLFMSFPFLEIRLYTFVSDFVLILLRFFLFGMFWSLFVLFPIQGHWTLSCTAVVHYESFLTHFSSIIKKL